MSSPGQIIGGIAGAVIGAFAGMPMLGASIGMAIGGAIDPPKGPKVEGPRLDDLAVQVTGYGNPIPRIYGTMATMGAIFWVENNALKETATTEQLGGKGGGASQESTTYSYSATFALGLCQGEIGGIRRIWISGKLVYDAADASLGAALATGGSLGKYGSFTLYTGTADQMPNPRMQATLGASTTPAYRGLAYIVFEDLQLADFGNSLMGAQIKVEVVPAAAPVMTSVGEFWTDLALDPGFAVDNDPTQWKKVNRDSTSAGQFISMFESTPTAITPYDTSPILTVLYTINQSDNMGGVVCKFGNPAVLILPPYPNGPYDDLTDLGAPIDIEQSDINALAHVARRDGVVWGASTTVSAGTVFKIPGARLAASASYEYMFHQDSVFSARYTGTGIEIKTWDDDFNFLATYTITYASPGYTFGGISERLLAWKIDRIVYTVEGSWPNTVKIVKYDLDALTRVEMPVSVQNTTLIDQFVRARAFRAWSHSLFSIAVTNIDPYAPIEPSNSAVFYFSLRTPQAIDPIPLSEIVESECLLSGLLSSSDLNVTGLTQEVIGFRVTSGSSIRSAIEPLQFAWPFDAVQAGYKIKFAPRGSGYVANVAEADLGAVGGGDKQAVRWTEAREMASQLPRRVEVVYIDHTREYDFAEQSEERLNVDSVSIQRVELPIVLTADEAAGIAQQTLYRKWLERSEIKISIPPTSTFLKLEAGDVVRVTTGDWQRLVRCLSLDFLPDGRIEVTGVFDEPAIYSPVAYGATPTYLGQSYVSPLAGPTRTNLLDIPCLADANNAPGWGLAMCGYSDAWHGANLYRSADLGATWSLVTGNRLPVTMGMTTNTLADGRCDIFDASGSVNVKLYSNTLSSSTLDGVLNGENHFAIGADGRWEIVGAVNATLEGDGSYTLSQLLRGRVGTEWATGTHQTGDQVVWLNDPDLAFVAASLNDISLLRKYKSVGYGNTADDGADSLVDYAYQGVNLLPLAPVHVNAWQDTTGDIYIGWTRQARVGWLWRDSIDASLGEASEKYEVDVYMDSSKVTKIATLEATTPAALLSDSQHTALTGGSLHSLWGDVYQISSSVGRGRAAPFVLAGKDPYLGYRTLALHFNGTPGQTTITDESGASFSRYGTTAVLSSTRAKFGGTSGTSGGGYSYWYTPDSAGYQFGAAAFTLRAWVYLTSAQTHPILVKGNAAGSVMDWGLFVYGTNQVVFSCFNAAGTNQVLITSETVPLNQWVLIEFVRSGTTGMVFINGTKSVTTATISNNIRNTASAQLMVIGQATINDFKGYADDMLIYNGLALNTTSYTPPTQEFPNG